CARARIWQIAGWALLTTLVSLVIQALEHVRGGGLVNRVIGWILGAAWALATFFVVPIIVCDAVGPVEAARRSVAVIRRRWGEGVTGSVAIGAIFGLVMIPVVIRFAIGWNTWDVSRGLALAVILVGAVLLVIVVPLESALMQMFKLVLYEYAAGNGTYGAFDEGDLEHAFAKKTKGRPRLTG